MPSALTKVLIHLREDETGVTLVEYGISIILALVVGGTLVLNGLGAGINTQLGVANTCMTSQGGTC